MRILYITTIGSTMNFFRNFVKELIEDGNTVDIAANENITAVPDFFRDLGCKVYQIDTSRSPLNKGNIAAINQIKKIVLDEHYDIVHCHTPVAAMCTRIACRKARKKGTKVFYTAHGFHFYKGAPLKNWIIYYPVEKLCSYFTDVLITINQEDYQLAKRRMKASHVEYIAGVGIDFEKFSQSEVDKEKKRIELGVPRDGLLLLSVGELNKNKNHEVVIRAIADMHDVYYMIAGSGNLENKLQELINELRMENRVKLLGYRNDVNELYRVSDVFIFPSFREGLSVSVMEAMLCGLPVVCSRIRGNIDLIDEVDRDGIGGGGLFDPHNSMSCQKAIKKLLNENINKIGSYNKEKVSDFEVRTINKKINELYIKYIARKI